jgi:hypothetical protein
MQLRAGVILTLTLIGILLLAVDTTDKVSRRQILGGGCFLLAGVYAAVTRRVW